MAKKTKKVDDSNKKVVKTDKKDKESHR